MGKGALFSAGLRPRTWKGCGNSTLACRKALAELRHHRKFASTLHCQSSTLLLSTSQCFKTHQLSDQPVDSVNSEINVSVNTSGGLILFVTGKSSENEKGFQGIHMETI